MTYLNEESSPIIETSEILPAAESRTSFMLEIQDDEEVRRVPITSKPLTIGTHRSSDIILHDRTVSSHHCTLAIDGGGIHVHDEDSRNGTFVGGARVHEAWGREGTTILVGHSTITCLALPTECEREDFVGVSPLPGVAGGSIAMCRLATQVRRLARLNAPVLIAGETGSGKELIARALHAEGHRCLNSFVALNVAALPRDLVESELFGHERGAFTGAVSRRSGAFVEAEGGSLFLDEIGELPLDAQPKLLRALDGYEVRRIGAPGSGRRADARVIAATHVPLLEQVTLGRFRRDLYHRLEVFVLELPPLRSRQGDVLPTAKVLLEQMEGEIGRRRLTSAAIAQLTAHDWPGNVRELRNVLYRAADYSISDDLIDTNAVVRALRRSSPSSVPPAAGFGGLSPENARDWLIAHHGNVSAAARAARIPRTSFRKLLARAGIVDTDE